MTNPETMKENAQALRNMTKDQEEFMIQTFQMSRQDMIELDEDEWACLLDKLFDIEIEDDNRQSAKMARHDRIVSDLITMMDSV